MWLKNMNNEQSSQRIMSDVYGVYWRNEKTHGPSEARTSLLKRVMQSAVKLEESDWILDLGSGRQILERQIERDWADKIRAKIATIDIAELRKKQLLMRDDGKTHHARGDGASLPYKDASFAMAVSSMGLELMPTGAIAELARVLKPNGKALLNVLDPSISTNRRDLIAQPRRRTTDSDRRSQNFWSHYAREGNIFNKGESAIRSVMEEYGLNIDRIETREERDTAWIEIDATRNRLPSTFTTTEGFVNGLKAVDFVGAGQPIFLRDIS